jgi:homoserine O-acetyltransferase
VLEDVRQAFVLDGTIGAARDNVVLVLHALTGSADVSHPDTGWWRTLVGPGLAVDTTRLAVLAPNLLGSCYGSTGPSTPWRVRAGTWAGDGFPPVTPRDMAALVGLLVDELALPRLAAVVGGSLGGMVAQEWLLLHPGRAHAGVVLAAPAAHTAQAIAWNHTQREALALGARTGDADAGVALARAVAMISFRTEAALESRFGRTRAGDDAGPPFTVQRWLAHHGERLAARFDAATYRTLLDAMDAHDVTRGRGSRELALRALGASVARLFAVGVPGDVLYSDVVVEEWARGAGAAYRAIRSTYGHDAFLLEPDQVGMVLRDAVQDAATRAAAPSSHPCGDAPEPVASQRRGGRRRACCAAR